MKLDNKARCYTILNTYSITQRDKTKRYNTIRNDTRRYETLLYGAFLYCFSFLNIGFAFSLGNAYTEPLLLSETASTAEVLLLFVRGEGERFAHALDYPAPIIVRMKHVAEDFKRSVICQIRMPSLSVASDICAKLIRKLIDSGLQLFLRKHVVQKITKAR